MCLIGLSLLNSGLVAVDPVVAGCQVPYSAEDPASYLAEGLNPSLAVDLVSIQVSGLAWNLACLAAASYLEAGLASCLVSDHPLA